MRSATRLGNPARLQLGASPLDLGAWIERPAHDAARGRFTTAIRVFESGPSTADEDWVNIDASLFGRERMLQLSLVDSLSENGAHRAAFNGISDSVEFRPGERAQDYVAGRDKLATHVIDIVFGGRTVEEIAAEAAADAAEAKRRAALPPPQEFSSTMKLMFFGMLGLMGLAAAAFAMRGGGSDGEPVGRDRAVDRALRTAPRR